MGNEQVKIEQEYHATPSNISSQQTEYQQLEDLIRKKKILDNLLTTKRHILSMEQINKINSTLNTLVNNISHLIHQQKNPSSHDFTSRNSDSNLILAMRLFKFSGKYTMDDLKTTYRKLAMATHPDKTGGDSTKFNLVMQCYEILMENLLKKQLDKPHHELKQGYQNFDHNTRKQTPNMVSNMMNRFTEPTRDRSNHPEDLLPPKQFRPPKNTENIPDDPSNPKLDKERFNPALFNKYYEKNRMWDPNDAGYQEWLLSNESEDPEHEALAKLQGKVSTDKFDQIFKTVKKKANHEIVKYEEPQALISCNTGFTALDGENEIGDFTKAPEARNGLGYTDLKTAYSKKGLFIDPDTVEYKSYKNVQEYEKDRANISFTMTPEQQEKIKLKQLAEEKAEQIRLQKLAERDNAAAQHYNRIHTQMLGYAPKDQ